MEQDYNLLADLMSKFQGADSFGKAMITIVALAPLAALVACFFGWLRHRRLLRASEWRSLPMPLRPAQMERLAQLLERDHALLRSNGTELLESGEAAQGRDDSDSAAIAEPEGEEPKSWGNR